MSKPENFGVTWDATAPLPDSYADMSRTCPRCGSQEQMIEYGFFTRSLGRRRICDNCHHVIERQRSTVCHEWKVGDTIELKLVGGEMQGYQNGVLVETIKVSDLTTEFDLILLRHENPLPASWLNPLGPFRLYMEEK